MYNIKNSTLITVFIVLFSATLFSTEIVIQPYLQNAIPSSIYIMWETSSGSESVAEWGLTNGLGNSTNGTAESVSGGSYIHTVLLTGLSSNTKYYYKVITEDVESDVFNFITPPLSSSENPFHLIAMSDMQIDGANPNKFYEIVHDGILNYVQEEFSDDLSTGLQMVLIPGDLVDSGWNYGSWAEEFFIPAEPLFSNVALYPVLGNHESNTSYYFSYFNLPDNGTSGYEEHWYTTDYSNVRIIGLDSNFDFQLSAQLNWLENILTETCNEEQIDFVFAQLHHPYLSELWLDGETEYTGEIITLLENFTTECGKPSIHFFGHTHGYSRGQSRDHNHLWVNVATAGGNIDYWNEYAQADYDEFTVSQDEWGFVSVDVEAGDFPQFTLKRINRGNEYLFRDNEKRDEITIKLNNTPPAVPVGIYPDSDGIEPECVELKASIFSDNDGDNHQASHWQVSQSCSDFSAPVIDRWKSNENWYNDVDTQENDNLTDEIVIDLSENSDFCWRVRYRDGSLGWSNWSEPVSFSTGESSISANLLINPGAELGTTSWIAVEGIIESLADGECEGISPHSGERFFAVGGVCENYAYGEAYQSVDVSSYSEPIDAGAGFTKFGGYLSNWGGSDKPEFALSFLDDSGNEISQTELFYTFNSIWTFFNEVELIPIGTREIRFQLFGTRFSGYDNDSYFDDLFLKFSLSEDPCDDSFLQGDINGDGFVDIFDILIIVDFILGNQTPTPSQFSVADLNHDTIIDVFDIVLMIEIILG